MSTEPMPFFLNIKTSCKQKRCVLEKEEEAKFSQSVMFVYMRHEMIKLAKHFAELPLGVNVEVSGERYAEDDKKQVGDGQIGNKAVRYVV